MANLVEHTKLDTNPLTNMVAMRYQNHAIPIDRRRIYVCIFCRIPDLPFWVANPVQGVITAFFSDNVTSQNGL